MEVLLGCEDGSTLRYALHSNHRRCYAESIAVYEHDDMKQQVLALHRYGPGLQKTGLIFAASGGAVYVFEETSSGFLQSYQHRKVQLELEVSSPRSDRLKVTAI